MLSHRPFLRAPPWRPRHFPTGLNLPHQQRPPTPSPYPASSPVPQPKAQPVSSLPCFGGQSSPFSHLSTLAGKWLADSGEDDAAPLPLARPVLGAWPELPTRAPEPDGGAAVTALCRRVEALLCGPQARSTPAGGARPRPLASAAMPASTRSCATGWGTPMGAPRRSCSQTPACRRAPAPCWPPWPSPSSSRTSASPSHRLCPAET